MMSSDYTLPVSRVSALTDKFLTLSQVERMLSATTAEDSFRILNDLSWAHSFTDSSSVRDFEKVIDAGLYAVSSSLRESSDSDAFQRFLFLPFDLQNAKSTLLHAHSEQDDYEDFREDLSPLGFYEQRAAFDVLTTGKVFSGEDAFFSSALLSAQHILLDDSTKIKEAETLLDAAFFQQMYRDVSSLRNPVLTEYFQKKVTAENGIHFLRHAEDDTVIFLTPESATSSHLRLSSENARTRLLQSSLSDAIIEGEKYLAEGKSIADVEIRITLTLQENLFWQARLNPLGVENLLLFFLTKLRNAEIIRSILVGKRNDFTESDIRNMVSVFLPFLPKS